MEQNTRQLIADLAARYETAAFLPADPSSFMHSVEGDANKEATAFLASCLSYGSRKQFFPKIQFIIDAAQGDVDRWVRSGEWRKDIPDTAKCYYRLYKFGDMHRLIAAYEEMLREYGSMKEYVRSHASTGIEAVSAICRYFAEHDASTVVPRNTQSACKRSSPLISTWLIRPLYSISRVTVARVRTCPPIASMPWCRRSAICCPPPDSRHALWMNESLIWANV